MAGMLTGGPCTIECMRRPRDQTKQHEAGNPCRPPILITKLAEILNRVLDGFSAALLWVLPDFPWMKSLGLRHRQLPRDLCQLAADRNPTGRTLPCAAAVTADEVHKSALDPTAHASLYFQRGSISTRWSSPMTVGSPMTGVCESASPSWLPVFLPLPTIRLLTNHLLPPSPGSRAASRAPNGSSWHPAAARLCLSASERGDPYT
jgi:hypothetical protein